MAKWQTRKRHKTGTCYSEPFLLRCALRRGAWSAPSPRIFASCYISPRHRLLFWLQFPSCLALVARIPMGMLTDRFGGRIVFSALMFFESI